MAKPNLHGTLRLVALTLSVYLSAIAFSVMAADGDVVQTFAPQIVRSGEVSQLLLQPDGKILAAGQFTTSNGTLRPYLARFTADGSLDSTFAPAVITFPAQILLQPDGKILVRGTAFRLNSDGARDQTFNPSKIGYLALLPNGKIVVNDSSSGYMTGLSRLSASGALEIDGSAASMGNVVYITTAVAQPDGKVIFAGNFSNYNGSERRGFARLNTDWSLDRSFPAGLGPIGPGFFGSVAEIVALTNGKIYIAGGFTGYDFAARPGIARLNSDGTLDASFDPPKPDAPVSKIASLPDGGLLIAGSFTAVGGVPRPRIARLKVDGSLDTSFDAPTAFDGPITTMAVQADGKILLGGSFSKIGDSLHFGIARLNANGTLDPTFNGGVASSALGNVQAVRRTAEERYVIAGSFTQVSGVERPGLARLNADGSLDPVFNPSSSVVKQPTAIELSPDGKTFVSSASEGSSRVVRLNADGSVDSTFKTASFTGTVNALILQSDGRLLIGGFLLASPIASSQQLIARLNSDGTPDLTFSFSSQENGRISALHVLADGKILVGGSFQSIGGVSRTNLARLNSNGTVDASYDLAANEASYSTIRFTPYIGGKVLVSGGFTMLAGMARNGLALLNSDGSLDATFVPALGVSARAVGVLPDGRILLAADSFIVRLNADGSPDFAFSFPVWSGVGEGRGSIRSLLVLPDGRAIVGGSFFQAGRVRTVRPLLAMFEAGGSAIPLPAAAVTSAANYRPAVAGGSIISIFGTDLAPGLAVATASPLPTTLNGVRVKFFPAFSTTDDELLLPLFFVSEKQINCYMQYLFPNQGYLLVEKNNTIVATALINAVRIAPGIFTADASGKGYPAAQVLRARADGSRIYEPVVTRDAAGQLVARPIDLGPDTDQVFLVIYSTGASGGTGLSGATALIGEVPAQIQYLWYAPGLVGVDQINVLIPRSLKGVNKDVDVKLTVDGIAANTVKINIR